MAVLSSRHAVPVHHRRFLSYSRTVISAFPLSPNSSEALEWRFLPDIDSEITIARCQLKQQHGEPLSSVKDDEADLDESIDDEVRTSLLTPLSLDGARVKEDFLNRLAERLHEAYVAEKLVRFLESVFGSVAVPTDLLLNFYPLANCP